MLFNSCIDISIEAHARDTVKKLIMVSGSIDRSEAAGLIVYRGRDSSRKWKDVYNYSHPDEKRPLTGFVPGSGTM